MKKLKIIETIEVKRCFAISQLIRFSKGKKYLDNLSPEEFKNILEKTKSKVLDLSDKELDKLVKGTYKKRLIAYDNAVWYLGEFTVAEAGVWRRAGDLPLTWTNGSLQETAEKVSKALLENSKLLKKRAKHAIPNIPKTNFDIQNEKYLLPITFIGGTGTRGRRRFKIKTALDIDDGCMRAISLAIKGEKTIKAYIGFPIKKLQILGSKKGEYLLK